MTLNQRIKYIRETNYLTSEIFAYILDLTEEELKNIESGEQAVRDDTIKIIIDSFWIDENWLRYGKGEMEKSLSAAHYDSNKDYMELLQSTFKVFGLDKKRDREYLAAIILEYVSLLKLPIKSTLKKSIIYSARHTAEHIQKYATHHIARKTARVNALQNEPQLHIMQLACAIKENYRALLIELFHSAGPIQKKCDLCGKKCAKLTPVYKTNHSYVTDLQICEVCLKADNDVHFYL